MGIGIGIGLGTAGGRAAPFTWTPVDLGGKTLWLRGDMGITLNGSTVAAWGDQSGGARDFTQGTELNQPTFVASAINGKPGVSFDGINDLLASTAQLSTFITNSAFTLWAVMSIVAIDTNSASSFSNDMPIGDAGGFWGLHLKSTGPTAVQYSWDGTDDHADVTVATGTPLVLRSRHAGGNLFIRRDNGSESSVASGNTTTLTNVINLGNRGGSTFFSGTICEVVLMNSDASAGDRTLMDAYLSARYGIW